MRGHLLQVDLHRLDQALVDISAVFPLRAVALGLAEALHKLPFQQSTIKAEDVGGQAQRAGSVGHDLHCLDARDIVEEPAATGVHELGVALHLHQLENQRSFLRREYADRLGREKLFDGRFRIACPSGEDDRNVSIARGPDIFQQTVGGAVR